MDIKFTDNSKEVKSAMHDALIRALEKIGMTAEKYAKRLCPVDTGNLRNSITHRVDEWEPAAYIGSGNKAQPYLKPAAADHAAQYRQIIENELKNG